MPPVWCARALPESLTVPRRLWAVRTVGAPINLNSAQDCPLRGGNHHCLFGYNIKGGHGTHPEKDSCVFEASVGEVYKKNYSKLNVIVYNNKGTCMCVYYKRLSGGVLVCFRTAQGHNWNKY